MPSAFAEVRPKNADPHNLRGSTTALELFRSQPAMSSSDDFHVIPQSALGGSIVPLMFDLDNSRGQDRDDRPYLPNFAHMESAKRYLICHR
jgi:hypothetical protein